MQDNLTLMINPGPHGRPNLATSDFAVREYLGISRSCGTSLLFYALHPLYVGSASLFAFSQLFVKAKRKLPLVNKSIPRCYPAAFSRTCGLLGPRVVAILFMSPRNNSIIPYSQCRQRIELRACCCHCEGSYKATQPLKCNLPW